MRFYQTQYDVQDPIEPTRSVTFSSVIYASNFAHACQLSVLRNIGEVVVGIVKRCDYNPCPLPSEFYQRRELMDCLHTLTFYGWIASMGRILDLRTMCNDLGLLHEVMHEMHHPNVFMFRQSVYDRMVEMETLIPGLKTYKYLTQKAKIISK